MVSDTRLWNGLRIAGWGTAVVILLLPLVAMQFTSEVDWNVFDFLVVAILFGGAGLVMELALRKSPSNVYRFGAAIALGAIILEIIVNGAVGMIGSEDNPYNLLFLGVAVVAVVGSVAARFRPTGMAATMAVAAVAQAAIATYGLSTDVRGGILAALFCGVWLLSAALFWSAAKEAEPA